MILERLLADADSLDEEYDVHISVELPDDDTEAHEHLEELQATVAALAQLYSCPLGEIWPRWTPEFPGSRSMALSWEVADSSSSSSSWQHGPSSDEDLDYEVSSYAESELQSGSAPVSAELPLSAGLDGSQGCGISLAQIMAEHERQFPLVLEASGARMPLTSAQLQRLQTLPQPVSQADLQEALGCPELAATAQQQQQQQQQQPQQYRCSQPAAEVCSTPLDRGLRRAPHSRASLSSHPYSSR